MSGNSIIERDFMRRYGTAYDVWGATHTCADCDECELAADEYTELEDVPREIAICLFRKEWTDGTARCADMCDGAWWPKSGDLDA
ncbi:MAG: hypothetical protein IJ113_01160 [Eggerthellaceae bacterium]|nr:hypothetical protein [Eggerthellaceae bacterium]